MFGRLTTGLRTQEGSRTYVAAAYDPAPNTWHGLPSPPKSVDGIYGYNAVWTSSHRPGNATSEAPDRQ